MMQVVAMHYKLLVLFFAIFNFIMAAWFLLWSNSLVRVNEKLKKWISTDAIDKALNISRDIDAKILGMRKILGFASALLAVVFLIMYINL